MPKYLLLLALTCAPAFAQEKSMEVSAAYSLMNAVKTFPDPLYLNEYDYVSATAQQGRLGFRFENFFAAPFELTYQGLSIKSASHSAQGNVFQTSGYYTSFINAASAVDTGVFRWHFGLAAFLTLSTRSYYDAESSSAKSEAAVDTSLSQVYPTGGFTLFPKAPIRFSMIFLNGDANLLYGWLRMQWEFEIGNHTFFPSFELLNHASFGRGVPDLVNIPGAVSFGYALRVAPARFFARAGFVLNATGGFHGTPVGISERLIFELGAGYVFSP
jgi:hypothetical protein